MMYTAIKGFVGLVGHCRCIIKDFTRIAEPLHEYAHGDTVKKKKESVVLNEAAGNAFHQLQKAVMSAPVLAYPDPKNICLKQMPQSLGWELCCPRSSQTGDITPWLSGIEHYMEQSSITTVLNLSFWP